MEFVDHNDRVGVRREVRDSVGMQGLNRGEHVLPSLGPGARNMEFAKSRVCQDLPIGAQRLFQDLLPMGHEQQGWSRWIVGVAEAPVVQGRDNRLAGSGCGDDHVAVSIVHPSLHRKGFQHLRLVRVRPNLETGERNGWTARPWLTGGLEQRVVKPISIPVWVVGFEAAVVPIGVEGGDELRHEGRRRDAGEPNVPLHAVQQRGAREVGRSYVGGIEFDVAPEQPRLRMQPRSLRVVLDLDLGAELVDQAVQRFALSRAHVRGGHDAKGFASFAESRELGVQDAQAMPLHEGA